MHLKRRNVPLKFRSPAGFVASQRPFFSVVTQQTGVIVLLFESTVPLWWMLSLFCCCSSASLILSSNAELIFNSSETPHGLTQTRQQKKLFCDKRLGAVFSQDGCPVKLCPSVVCLATHFEARLWYVRWSLFSITLLTLVAWARLARAVMVNMRRWGIVDLRLPLRRHSWRITPSLQLQRLLLHLSTQSRLTHIQSDCINRCFQGETVDRSHWDQIEVCMFRVPRSTCVHVCTAMWCFYYALCMHLD